MALLEDNTKIKISIINEITIVSVCRICLENEATIPLFETCDEDEPDIQSKLSVCLKEKIEDIEGYPRFICKVCYNVLNSAYKFIEKYKQTCNVLKSGLIIKREKEAFDISNFEEDIQTSNIKYEFNDRFFSDDGFSEDDKELLEPLHKIKLKVEEATKTAVKKKSIKTNNRLVTTKIASSILEGEFMWNGDKWCLKANKPAAVEKPKLLQNKAVKRQRIRIEIPKIKKEPDPQKLCDICGEVCKDRDKLALHKRKIHFKQSIACPHCPKMFCSNYYLNRHIKRKHTDKKEFVCAVCGSKFAFKGELQSHHKNVHEKHLRPKKQFKCKICSKSYKCAKSVLVHERSVHTGHRPAVCDVCDSSFYHIDYLKEHMRLHTGETPFKCPICGRGYAQRCNMKSHLRIHRVSELDAATLSKLRPNYLRLLKA